MECIPVLLFLVKTRDIPTMSDDFEMEVMPTEEAKRKISRLTGGRQSRYEPIVHQWAKTQDDESIVLSGLESNDVQNLRNLLYRRFEKENVIVRSAKQGDGSYKALIRSREGSEFLPGDE